MRFSTIFVSGALAVLASAASTTVGLTPAQSSAAACIDKCDVGDVDCQSHCVAVPSPSDDQANDTTKCAAACDQGDGSAEATQKYSTCVQDCITKNYFRRL
ncbi:hypothetical protein G7046_g5829 [Stylonectria norvegica]|nr:hypothetical protein G7046_g5829 [Stylonectria norvegica]